jgi:hypothetical protein
MSMDRGARAASTGIGFQRRMGAACRDAGTPVHFFAAGAAQLARLGSNLVGL